MTIRNTTSLWCAAAALALCGATGCNTSTATGQGGSTGAAITSTVLSDGANPNQDFYLGTDKPVELDWQCTNLFESCDWTFTITNEVDPAVMSAWAVQVWSTGPLGVSVGDFEITDTTTGDVLDGGNMGTFTCSGPTADAENCVPVLQAVATSDEAVGNPPPKVPAGDNVKIVLHGADLAYPGDSLEAPISAFPIAYHLSTQLAWH